VIREACEAIKERGPLKEWEVKDLQKVIKYHVETIHGHHSNEDDVLVPEGKDARGASIDTVAPITLFDLTNFVTQSGNSSSIPKT